MSYKNVLKKQKTAGCTPVVPMQVEDETGSIEHFHGLTKRELFAAMAMQGIASRYVEVYEKTSTIAGNAVAEFSVMLADELIKRLNK